MSLSAFKLLTSRIKHLSCSTAEDEVTGLPEGMPHKSWSYKIRLNDIKN